MLKREPAANLSNLMASSQAFIFSFISGELFRSERSCCNLANSWGDEYGVLYLFKEEYSVPFLNYEVAAFLATAGELILPVFQDR